MKKRQSKPRVLVIVGPNASGKSALAVTLARNLNGEVISADSRQVYQGLDIGSGKVTKKEMRGVPHYLLDVASLRRVFTVRDYQKLAGRAIQKVLSKKKLPIVCGGTGLYIDALLYNWNLPNVKPNRKLREQFDKLTAEKLFLMLRRADPRRAENIDRHNKRRLVRALEIIEETESAVPVLERDNKAFDILTIGIKLPEEILKLRIKKRLALRLKKGMIREVQKLHREGLSWKRLDDLGLEYRYISRYLRGVITKKQMIDCIEKESWAYAKRQMIWFKRNNKIVWVSNEKDAVRLAKVWLTKAL